MPNSIALVFSDHVESGQIRAAILKQRSISSLVLPYGLHGKSVTLPRGVDIIIVDSHYGADAATSLIQQIRGLSSVPLILLTDQTDIHYLLDVYALGVHECVTKPISELLFLAKVGAWLGHTKNVPSPEPSRHSSDSKVAHSGYTLDPQKRVVCTRDGHSIRLSYLEFRLFQIFLANPGRTLETNQLLKNVWNYEEVDSRLLTNLVYRLRQKLALASIKIDPIQTVERIGYKFD